MLEIPRTQTVAEVVNPGPDARMAIRHDAPVATPGPGEVLLKLECTGVWVVAPAGHELLGARVGIKWLHNACGACSLCRKGRPNNCASQTNTGKHVPGTLAQYVVGAATHVSRIPEGLASEVAAPLLCAGLTMVGALNPLKELEKGDWVVISGSGGGLGHVGVQLAAARGLRVIAVDAGKSKKTLSLESGATAFIDYKTDDVASEVRRITEEGAHAAIVVPGDATAFEAAPPLVRNGGVIVCVGLPPNDYTLPIGASILSARALTVTGVSVGTEKEMDELLALAADGRVTSKVEVVDFERIGEVMERLKNDEITGRVVVRLPQ